MGLMLAEPGFHTRLAVEWEEYPRSSIIAAQRAGYFAPAPIWSDLTTFDARPFAGAFDTLLAGYPCQPFSMAGNRLGEDDPRHLWPHVARVIRELGASLEWVFLENVPGHISLGAETVLRELWDMGFTPAVGIFSAAETGAPHERQRWFCVAHRTGGGQREQRYEAQPGCRGYADCSDGNLADAMRGGASAGARPYAQTTSITAGRGECTKSGDNSRSVDDSAHGGRGIHAGQGPEGCGAPDAGRARGTLAHAQDADRGRELATPSTGSGRAGFAGDGAELDDTQRIGCNARRHGDHRSHVGQQPDAEGGAMADASQQGQQGREQPGSSLERYRPAAHGPASERGRPWLFPPGPGDAAAWQTVMASAPDLAPSGSLRDIHTWARDLEAATGIRWEAEIEPALCRMVDGLAARTQPLRLLGNGVFPVAAAYAWRALSAAHGLRPVDLETTCDRGSPNAAGDVVKA